MDKVLDEAERQIIKLKQRRLEQRRIGHKIKEELISSITAPSSEIEREGPTIIEEELVIDKPMSVEDAIFELQESGVFFLPFVDAKTGELKIAYRKRSGSFGIINTKCKGHKSPYFTYLWANFSFFCLHWLTVLIVVCFYYSAISFSYYRLSIYPLSSVLRSVLY